MKKRTVVFFFLAVLLLALLGTPSWGAPQYLGQSTWTLTITMNEKGTYSEPPTGTITMAITRMGGTYYTVQGYIIPTDDDGPFILAGGGVLIGETFYLNLSGTQKHTDKPNRDTEIMQVQLNKTTLNGTFYSVGRDFNLNDAGPSPVWDSRFQAGTLTLTGSIINLSSNLTGPMTLLLNE